jgi:hypothetical protein
MLEKLDIDTDISHCAEHQGRDTTRPRTVIHDATMPQTRLLLFPAYIDDQEALIHSRSSP